MTPCVTFFMTAHCTYLRQPKYIRQTSTEQDVLSLPQSLRVWLWTHCHYAGLLGLLLMLSVQPRPTSRQPYPKPAGCTSETVTALSGISEKADSSAGSRGQDGFTTKNVKNLPDKLDIRQYQLYLKPARQIIVTEEKTD